MKRMPRGVMLVWVSAALGLGGWGMITGLEGAPAVRPNSFQEVTAHLEPGGELYLYLSTAQWFQGLGAKVNEWREVLGTLPMPSRERETLERVLTLIVSLIQDSGLEEVSGVGLSSVVVEPGLFRNREIIHHYRGQDKGFIWSMLGRRPHALNGLDLMPDTTALAVYLDLDLRQIWQALSRLLEKWGPEARNALLRFEMDFEKEFGVVFDKALDSFDGEVGLVLSLDDTVKIPLPMMGGRNQPFEIPEPQLMLVLKVKDDTLYQALGRSLNKAFKGGWQKNDQGEVQMLTLPRLPAPLPLPFRPTLAFSGSYLFLATSDEMVKTALAVKAGKRPSLKTTAEFARLSKGLPTQGNAFGFTSRRLGEVLTDLQQGMARMAGGPPGELMRRFGALFTPGFDYGVFSVTDEGWITVSQGSHGASEFLLAPVVFTAGLLGGIAIPNFARARSTAMRNACINNLRQLESAKEQWALENKKPATEMPTFDDLVGPKKYIRQMPVCPAGGKYTLGTMEERPTCTIPDHRLP